MKCSSCGTKNPDKTYFCTKCSVLLPSTADDRHINQNFDYLDALKSGKDIFSTVFAGSTFGKSDQTAAKASQHPSRPRNHTTKQSPPEVKNTAIPKQTQSRAQVLKTVAKAAAKAITKSLALSAAVLGPGFIMLSIGLWEMGMVWLFFGSFGLMAWTYRKPWRLGLISCLMPPLAAGLCYGLQLWLFGSISPPAILLLAAIGIGLAVGFWRAQTHDIKQSNDGGIIAERTIGYLLVWVAAYGITQGLALITASTYAIRAGLVTGAFSTAMLATVSLVLLNQRSRFLAKSSLSSISSLLVLGTSLALGASFLAPHEARADAQAERDVIKLAGKKGAPAAIVRALPSGTRFVGRRLTSQKRNTFTGAKAHFAFQRSSDKASITVIFSKIKPKSGSAAQLLEQMSASWRAQRHRVVQASCGSGRSYFAVMNKNATQMIAVLGSYMLFNEVTASFPGNNTNRPAPLSAGQYKRLALATCRLAASSSASAAAPPSARRAVPRRPETNRPSTNSPGTNRPVVNGRTKPPVSSKFDPPIRDDRPDIPMVDIAKITAAVATILIAAGVAVNVSQAIAAAIANALQAGVQLTAEELQGAIADALLNKDKPTPAPQSEPDAPAGGNANAPPNVTLSEQFRPPTPIKDENGDPFETNHKGQYWGPDDKGDWRWLSKSEALEASAALRQEATIRGADQAENRRKSDEMMEQSRRDMAERHAQEREDEARDKQERKADFERRDQLYEGLQRTLLGLPPEERNRAALEMLSRAQSDGDTAQMEWLWEQLRGQRQQQVDELHRSGQENQRIANNIDRAVWAATQLRDKSKTALGIGLGIASGGTASVLQAAGTVVVGGGALTGIGAIERGVTAKDGVVRGDGWEATKGAARGALDAAGKVVGGITTHGSRAVMAGKAVFSGTSAYGSTYADTFEKTGDRDLAHSRATMTGATAVGSSVAGDVIDDKMRQSQQSAEGMKMQEPADWGKNSAQTWGDTIDGLLAADQTRIAAAKSASNITGNTLTTIASSDKDVSTLQAFGGALKGEIEGKIIGKVVGQAETTAKITPKQQAVIDRLNAERAGTAPQPDITPDYSQHLSQRQRGAGSTIPEGKIGDLVDAPSETGDTGGFTRSAQQHAQEVADSMGVKITARRVGPDVAAELDSGRSLPKGPKLKANTGKVLDTELGLDAKNVNKVVIFDPELPPRGNRTDAEWNALQARHKMRQDQAAAYRQKIIDSDEFGIEGQLVVNKKTGQTYVGDKDVFSVTGLYGEPVPKAVSDETLRRVIRNPEAPGQDINSMVEHREHLGWKIGDLDDTGIGADGKTERQRAMEINNRILAGVRPGQEPLATFSGRPGMAPPKVGAAHYTGPGPNTTKPTDD